jgi:plasmid stabilization system protein ParE
MSFPVVLTVEAERDFDAAADWYEEQAGLSAEFTARVRDIVNHIGEMPELHSVLHRNFRRAKINTV